MRSYGPWEWSELRSLRPIKRRRFTRALDNLTGIVLDVETGGLDPSRHALLQIGWVELIRGIPVATRNLHIKPRGEVDPEIGKINGWTGKPHPDAVCESLALAMLASATRRMELLGDEKPLLIGHNVDFNARFLGAACIRVLSVTHELMSAFGHRRVDTCQLALPLEAFGEVGERSLDGLCRHFGLWDRLQRASLGHKSAEANAIATLAVLYELLWRFA